MQQTFQNFETCEANAAAVSWCRRIAALEEEFDGPVVLQGGPQVGKSHLLWSIVEDVRAHERDAALVLIRAHDFPDRVKSLVARPAPIQTPRPALLLVDDLQEFDESAGDLEAVVECFLENGHNVVLATNISPQFLHVFSIGFRQLLAQGEKVVVGKRSEPASQPLATEPDVISRLRAECEALHEERLALQQELDKHRTRADRVEVAESRMAEAEEARRQSAALAEQAQLARQAAETREREVHAEREAALDETHRMRRELEAMRRERDGLHAAREALRKRLTRLTQATDAASRFETDLQRVQEERDRLRADYDGLTAQLQSVRDQAEAWRVQAESAGTLDAERDAEYTRMAELLRAREGMEEAMEEMSREREAVRDVLQRLAEQSEAVLDQLNASEEQFGEGAAPFVAMLREFLTGVSGQSGEWGVIESGVAADGSRSNGDEAGTADDLRHEFEQVSGLYEESRAEQGRLSVAFEATRGRLGRVEYELAKARKAQAFLVAEMESLRREAAGQVATANLQAGELEHGIAAVAGLLEQWRGVPGNGAPDLERLRRDLGSAVRHLHDMADKVAVLKREIGAGGETDEEPDQGILFDTEETPSRSAVSIQDLGSTLEALSAPATSESLSLADAVQQALNLDEISGDRA